MPKHLAARPPLDAAEERHVRKLAHSAHAPADWIVHAKLVARSWDRLRTRQIAEELDCHPQTVRDRLHAFNDRGVDGLGIKPGSGRKPRLTQLERSTILALVKRPPPGKPTYERTGERAAPDPQAERRARVDPGYVDGGRPGTRRPGGAQPGAPHLPPRGGALAPDAAVGQEQGSRFRPKRTRIVALYTAPPAGATVVCVDELGPVTPRNFPPAPGWSVDGHRIKVPLSYDRGLEKVWVYGALCVRDGHVLKRDGARTQHRRVSGPAAGTRPGLSPR